MEKCLFFKNGKCQKYDGRAKCAPSDKFWCDEPLETISPDRICEKSSIFGNYYFFLTEEQLEDLKNGKVLYHTDEYGMFIALI